jgi:hypothetical protein
MSPFPQRPYPREVSLKRILPAIRLEHSEQRRERPRIHLSHSTCTPCEGGSAKEGGRARVGEREGGRGGGER